MYREDRDGLLSHLAALMEEAAVELGGAVLPARLAERFTGWARPRA
ncbi:hypothetical protein ACGFI4_02175 [Micromonospora carbonacea]|nr:hypothetical protein [Micromonospora carbonacea]